MPKLEQIFGPVLTVAKFKTEEEAISLANNTTYGLGSSIFTTNHSQSLRVSSAIEAGVVWVNSYAILPPQAPFGGYKQSGIGRELGSYGLDGYCQIKAVHHNMLEGSSGVYPP
jgi:aldehyde dehydrogenase (NAD+)